MLSKVDFLSRQGELLSLPLDDISQGVIVADIDGLGPVKATIVSSSFAGLDGEQHQSARREKRQLKFTLELDPPGDETVRSVRKRLYDYFMTKAWVKMTFFLDDGLVVETLGQVESCEPVIFSKEPMVEVILLCFDPDFIDPTPVVVSGLLTSDVTPHAIEYDGTVDTGVKISMTVDQPTLNEFTVYHTSPGGDAYVLDFAAPLVLGDVLTISTVEGAKGATLVRDTTTSSILYGISPTSKWIALEKGTNQIYVSAEGPGIPVTIEYIKRYGGL